MLGQTFNWLMVMCTQLLASLKCKSCLTKNCVKIKYKNIAVSELKKTLLSGEDCLNVQKAAKGDEVTVHYEGRLQSNGFKFDSSFDRGEPIKFTLGTNQVVQGWERGLVGTCPGQSIKLEIPSNLGYGQTGAGDVIPPNADLVFEIKLEAIKSKEVKIDVFEPIVGCPEDEITRDNDVIRFNYIGYFEDGKFLFSFVILVHK